MFTANAMLMSMSGGQSLPSCPELAPPLSSMVLTTIMLVDSLTCASHQSANFIPNHLLYSVNPLSVYPLPTLSRPHRVPERTQLAVRALLVPNLGKGKPPANVHLQLLNCRITVIVVRAAGELYEPRYPASKVQIRQRKLVSCRTTTSTITVTMPRTRTHQVNMAQ